MGELLEIPLESLADVRRFDAASELFHAFQSEPLMNDEWAFRGHASAAWRLESTIERLGKAFPKSFRPDAEDYVRYAFKRRAYHHLREVPDSGNELEWLALMRHHGAPTRLLDWTRSPYVAAFFATAEAKEEEMSAIWAIDIRAINDEAIGLLADAGSITVPVNGEFSLSEPSVFNAVFIEGGGLAIVAPVQPFRTNERLISQQSLFLCPTSLTFGFELGLKQLIKSYADRMEKWLSPEHEVGMAARKLLWKLEIAPQARCGILRELHRMNISYATLLPGLDGFAHSLHTNATISEGLACVIGEELDGRI